MNEPRYNTDTMKAITASFSSNIGKILLTPGSTITGYSFTVFVTRDDDTVAALDVSSDSETQKQAIAFISEQVAA